jgi:hypothetical protein
LQNGRALGRKRANIDWPTDGINMTRTKIRAALFARAMATRDAAWSGRQIRNPASETLSPR